ncbi:putative polyketide synthase 34 [Gossypium arboreum]|uniref:Putative polyketide synthase 34 n=1 Tax=Gossypium arboreum TaxID=29729 RepID=A0A0B0N6R6_GOSAR|nr:putative polyketide synthase 34 [Gossypium arboreum]
MCCEYLIACVSSPCSYVLTDSLCEQTHELLENELLCVM